MPLLRLHPRDDTEYWGYSNGAKWAYFAIFIAVILIILFFTFKANKNRMLRGKVPIRGTAWLTPPLYHHSQNAYNQPREGGAYVPEYSATGNANDAGYYNNDGTFVPYLGVETDPHKRASLSGSSPVLQTPIVSDETGFDTDPGRPALAHLLSPSQGGNPFYGGDDGYELGAVSRPVGPPPGHMENDGLPGYTEPRLPLPSRLKN